MMSSSQYQLHRVTDDDLALVLCWFNSAHEVFYWGGPDLSYPMTMASFKQESKFAKSHSYVLKSGDLIVAFGQFYNRLERCHLGRLVMAPDNRVQGIGVQLIEHLNNKGQQVLGLNSGSLFVLDDNKPALRLYEKLGYQAAEYPTKIPIKSCLYLIKN